MERINKIGRAATIFFKNSKKTQERTVFFCNFLRIFAKFFGRSKRAPQNEFFAFLNPTSQELRKPIRGIPVFALNHKFYAGFYNFYDGFYVGIYFYDDFYATF